MMAAARGVISRSREFLGLLFSRGLWKVLARTRGLWRSWYVIGLLLFYLQLLLPLVVLVDRYRQMPRFLVHAGSFVMLGLIATLLLLLVGTGMGVRLARLGLSRPRLLNVLVSTTRFPVVVWVLLVVPALSAEPRRRWLTYWAIVLFFVIAWSVVEIAREVAAQGRSDVVYSLENLGVDDDEIFRTHILVGGCREFVVAHLFDLWHQLLLIELAMGFGVRYAMTLTEAPDLLPYKTSFGYLLAASLEQAQERFLKPEAILAAALLGVMFLSYWFIQVGVLQMRRAGGIDYLKALLTARENEHALNEEPPPGPPGR